MVVYFVIAYDIIIPDCVGVDILWERDMRYSTTKISLTWTGVHVMWAKPRSFSDNIVVSDEIHTAIYTANNVFLINLVIIFSVHSVYTYTWHQLYLLFKSINETQLLD